MLAGAPPPSSSVAGVEAEISSAIMQPIADISLPPGASGADPSAALFRRGISRTGQARERAAPGSTAGDSVARLPMLFTSAAFLVFQLAVVALRWTLPSRWTSALLLGSSYLFYLSWGAVYGLLIGAMTLVGWGAGLAISRGFDRRRVVGISVVLLLGTLGGVQVRRVPLRPAPRARVVGGTQAGPGPAARDLVLHVRGDLLRGRRRARRAGGAIAPAVRALRRATTRTSSPARSSARASCSPSSSAPPASIRSASRPGSRSSSSAS